MALANYHVNPPLIARGVSTWAILLVAAHQLHLIIRFLPPLHACAALLFSLIQLLISRRKEKDPRAPTSFTQKYGHFINFTLGIASGAQYTLFIWSLLKLPPVVGLVFALLSLPITKLINGSYNKETLISLFLFGLCISNHSPLDPHSLTRALLACSIDVAVLYFKSRFDPTGSKEPVEMTGMAISSGLVVFFASPKLFSEQIGRLYNPYGLYPAQAIIASIAVPIFGYAYTALPELVGRQSTVLPDAVAVFAAASFAGMRERISWTDMFSFILIGGLRIWQGRKDAQAFGEKDVETGVITDITEMESE
jgi:hypothetical protein